MSNTDGGRGTQPPAPLERSFGTKFDATPPPGDRPTIASPTSIPSQAMTISPFSRHAIWKVLELLVPYSATPFQVTTKASPC